MNIEIDAKQVEAAVTAAIIQSSIGEQIKKAVDSQLSNTVGRDGAIQMAVTDVVRKMAFQIVDLQYRPLIEEKVRAKISAEMISQVIDALMAKLEQVLSNGRW